EERLYSEAGRRSLAGEASRAARLEVAKQRLVPGLDGRLLPRPRRLEALEGRGPAAGAARAARAPGQCLLARGARDVLGLLHLGEPPPVELAAAPPRRAAGPGERAQAPQARGRPRPHAPDGQRAGILGGATRQSVTHRHTGGGFMRRYRRGLVVAAALAAVVRTPSVWAGESSPAEQLKAEIDRVVKTLEDPALQGDARSAERRALVRQIAEVTFDWTETA